MFSLFFKAEVIFCLFLGITKGISAASVDSSPQVIIIGLPKVVCTSPLSYYVDASRKLSFNEVKNMAFSTQTGDLRKAINKYLQRVNYWIKFSLENIDTLPAVAYLDAGYFSSIQVYEINKGKITVQTGGVGVKKDIHTSYPELYTMKIVIPPQTKIQYVLRLSSTEYYGVAFGQVNVFSRRDLYEAYYNDYYDTRTFRLLQILFLGFMLSQMLYVGLSRVIGIKRKEYLFYLLYLSLVTAYYILKYNDTIGIYWPFEYYPKIQVYLKSILLVLPYLFYLKFIRYFLNVKELDDNVYRKIIGLEYFVVIYVLIDTILRLFLPIVIVLDDILMVTVFGIFIYCLALIIELMRYKKLIISLILTGSLIAGLGEAIGILITVLQIDTGLLHTNFNSLISGQIAIVIETIIFTTSLSLKTRMMEKEKIENQEKLIVQLEENQALKERMEKTRNKIARDLHDDIGSTLSSILLLSNSAKTKVQLKNNEATEIFSKISKIASGMMDEMSDIIWAINPMQDSMDKILKRMHYYAAPLTLARNMHFDFEADEEIRHLHLSMEKRKNLFLIFKESVINALKYSEGTSIYVTLYHADGSLHMLVKDDGMGFSQPSEQGNGLNNMKVRAEDVGGQLEIRSSNNTGTTVHLMVPL
jgi:signal transduction histidine kinase